jgi:hypothetical protein
VLINGVTVTVKVAHVRLCHSRMLFVRAYPRETQEAKAIDEDIHQVQDGRLPAGLVYKRGSPPKRPGRRLSRSGPAKEFIMVATPGDRSSRLVPQSRLAQ